MKPTAFLGIDLGTGSVKALVVASDGRILGRASAEYPTQTPRPGHSEQNPADWWRGMVQAVRAALAECNDVDVAAIGLSGQMHGTVLVGDHGESIGPAIIWSDTRSLPQVAETTALIGAERLIELTGSPLATGFQAATIRWLQTEQPERWSRTRKVLLPKDYLGFRLTGDFVTEPSDASSTLLLDVRRRDWAAEVLAALNLTSSMLPEIRHSVSPRGHLLANAAAQLGLPAGLPVVAGGADAPLAALAAGVVDPGTALLTISSGSQVIVPTRDVRVDPRGRIHAWCSCLEPHPHGIAGSEPGAAWYQMGATLTSGLALRWLRDRVFALNGDDSYNQMTTWAELTPPGAGGLVFLPYLAGERTPHMDPRARGLFLGLTTEHDRGHLTRAVMEGATLALYDAFSVLVTLGASPRQAILAGGGARSKPWQQIVADVFGLPILPLANVEGSAFGAAMVAAAGVGGLDLASIARDWARYGTPVRPIAAAHEVYQRLLPIFRDAYVKHRTDFVTLAAIGTAE